MTIYELQAKLAEMIDDGRGNTEILIAIQPSWPLALNLHGVVLTEENDDDGEPCEFTNNDNDYCSNGRLPKSEWCSACLAADDKSSSSDSRDALWFVASDGHPYGGSPYAERKLWDRQ